VILTGTVAGTDVNYDFATIKYCFDPFPANDLFVNRSPLSGSLARATAHNSCASKELGETNHAASNVGGKSLWWTWMAPSNGLVTVSTCGSDFDTMLAVYTGNAVNSLTLVSGGSNDDNASACGTDSLQSQVQFTATAGIIYQIAVDGYKYLSDPLARSGNIVLTIQQ
jgi:hypothetical protein